MTEESERLPARHWRDTLARYASPHVLSGVAPHHLDRVDLLGAVARTAAGELDDDLREYRLLTSADVTPEDILVALQQFRGVRDQLDAHERTLQDVARTRFSHALDMGQVPRSAHEERVAALGALRDATVAADAPWVSTAARIRAIVGLRRAVSDVLAGGALSVLEVQAACGCSDFTIALARDVDYDGDDTFTDDCATGAEHDLRLQAVELMLDDQWRNPDPNARICAGRRQHPAVPHPVRTWNQLDAGARDAYRAEARSQLAQPPAPNRFPWTFEWRTWHKLLSVGTVVAEKDPSMPGYWLLYDPARVEPGHHLDTRREDFLADLAEAGLVLVDHAASG